MLTKIGGGHPVPDIERVLFKFLKQILKVKSQTPSAAIYGELGCVPMHILIAFTLVLVQREKFRQYIIERNIHVS